MNRKIRVGLLSYSDSLGGAGRAAYRLHSALKKHKDIDSKMFVNHSAQNDPTVLQRDGKIMRFITEFRPRAGRVLTPLYKTDNPVKFSPAIFRSGWADFLNRSDLDIVHLHWPHFEMLSISDIARINKPIVWTMHDMWAFCGAEHISTDNRYKAGYLKNNRPPGESGFDINRWAWNRKKRNWKNPFRMIAPSSWMAKCAKSSYLMKDWPVHVIPNTIDTDFWKPIDKNVARSILGIPSGIPVILFGSQGYTGSTIKGFDLLLNALKSQRLTEVALQMVVLGEKQVENNNDYGFPIQFLGYLNDDLSLKIAYSAADAVVIPSRIDNLPNMALEAMSCGVPVVAFDTCGLPDIIRHKENGWLAQPFNTDSFAEGIEWIISDPAIHNQLSKTARDSSITRYSNQVISTKHFELYNQIST